MTTTRRIRATARRATSMLAALCVAAAAASCTVEDEKSPATASGSNAPAVPAAAPGVTADSIRIGVVYPDFAALKPFVNLDAGDFEVAYKALIAKINAAGGINGRKIVPVFAKINLLAPASAQETCVKLTEDEKVFAVLGMLPIADQTSCYVQAHKTALIGGAMPAALYAQARAPWFTDIDGDASAKAVEALAAHGDLTGRKIAVVADAQGQTDAENVLLPALKRHGVTPVATGYLASTAGDPAATLQQGTVLLQKARTAGADTILLTGGAASQIPAILEKSDWRPRLLFSLNPSGYTQDKGRHDFGTLTGSVVVNPVLDWTEPRIVDCVRTVEQADPSLTGKLVDPTTVAPGLPTLGGSVQTACINLSLFEAIAGKAGKDLNYNSFQQAGFGLGKYRLPNYRDDATYAQQTPSGALPFRIQTYEPGTNRFIAVPS
ncbi:ABC transporter substrate-binding protein [Embleya sp. NPDC008237]|uniref:ABC transporter substrate-binding protein n=1 Tax=Embleya sp. NPDC008237 TaxID=3363978 RepID=UPI0036E311E0